MAELKIGGNDVVKIMYGDHEIGGATKLEPGTILYISYSMESTIKNLHLLSTTKNWNNINGIKVSVYNNNFSFKYGDADIPSDDFKNLYKEKSFKIDPDPMNISISIVDGEYRLNIKTDNLTYKFMVKAI